MSEHDAPCGHRVWDGRYWCVLPPGHDGPHEAAPFGNQEPWSGPSDDGQIQHMTDLVFGLRPVPTKADLDAQETIVNLIRDGYLIGVEVFGTDGCCAHPHDEDCPSAGFGLCDMFGPHSVGSDCNRANRVLMRPSDIIDFGAVAAELTREDPA